MCELTSPAEAKILEIEAILLANNPKILDRYPIESYLSVIRKNPDVFGYKKVALKLKKFTEEKGQDLGETVLPLYHKLGLASLVKESAPRLIKNNIPESIRSLYIKWFSRAQKDLDGQLDDYFSLENDEFLKDIAVCSLRMIPIGGAWTVEVERVSKRSLLAGGPAKYVDNALFHLFKQRGLWPYYVIHTYDRYMPRFVPEEMDKSYFRIATLLKQNPKIRGIYRGSWFLDPEMDRISPRLSFLRQVPLENGARLFRIKTRDDDVKKAITNSPERKKLYDEGGYEPACWGYVWPREKVIQWAEKSGQTGAAA